MEKDDESKKKPINLKGFPRYDDNPSSERHKVEGLFIGTYNDSKKGYVVNDGDDVVEDVIVDGWRVRVFDRFQFVKLFPDAQLDLVKLSSPGIAVFSYVVLNLKKQQDQIVINSTLFGEWYRKLEGCEKANVKMICYRGILDLLKHKLIFMKTGEGSFFINVNKFFNGTRVKIPWVAEINEKLENGESVPKKAVEFNPDYKPKNK